MNSLLKRLLDRGLELNERAASTALNGFDWLFRRDNLVKSGRTWFDVVSHGDPMSVRHYDMRTDGKIELADGSLMPVAQELHEIPLLLVPPLGVTSETFDLMPNRSLVRYMAARGFKVYMIDWGTPEKRHARLRLKDYADRMMNQAIEDVLAHSGARQVSLMGWCMGGLLSLMQAGLREDERIANIITVASPIDVRGGGVIAGLGQALNTPARLMRKFTDFRLHSIDPKRMHVPGWLTTVVFKLTDPVGSVTTYWDLLMGLWDREFVESHSTTSDYLNNMLSYPAGVVQDMLIQVSVDNKLAKGEIKLGSKISRMANIHAPFYVFAGENDVLVAPSAASGSVDLVSSRDKRFEIAPGGHMGVILGARAQSIVWAKSADWLATRSAARPLAKPARRRRASAATESRPAPQHKAAPLPKPSKPQAARVAKAKPLSPLPKAKAVRAPRARKPLPEGPAA